MISAQQLSVSRSIRWGVIITGLFVGSYLFSVGFALGAHDPDRNDRSCPSSWVPQYGVDCFNGTVACGIASGVPQCIPVSGLPASARLGDVIDCDLCRNVCASGQIECPGACKVPAPSNPVCVGKNRITDQCSGDCGACVSGFVQCADNLCHAAARPPSCPEPNGWDACTGECAGVVHLNPSAAQAGFISVIGNISAGSGDISGDDLRIAGDIYLAGGKALHVDSGGATGLQIGNYGGGAFTLDIAGGLNVTGGASTFNLNLLHLSPAVGRVGIGSTAPAERLEVADSTAGTARVRITDTVQNPEVQLQYGSAADAHWAFYVDHSEENKLKIWGGGEGAGDDRVTIDSDGNVGIGTVAPSAKLDISGHLRVTGDIIMPTASSTVDGVNLDNAILSTGSYVDPVWLYKLSWGKLTGFPDACPDGQFVTAVGGETLVCTKPVLGGSNGCFGPGFQQGSESALNGERGGYRARVCPSGMSICTGDEIINSIRCGASLPGVGRFWVLGGFASLISSGSGIINDCAGLTSGAGTDFGLVWDFEPGDGGAVFPMKCSAKLQFACCN